MKNFRLSIAVPSKQRSKDGMVSFFLFFSGTLFLFYLSVLYSSQQAQSDHENGVCTSPVIFPILT
jgi:hypothetical protein